MQRTKTISLTTQLFNKFSNKSFISKTCSIHPALLPLYICLNCVTTQQNPICQQCFNLHICNNKQKQLFSTWVSKQQYNITKLINTLQRDTQQTIQSLKSINLIIPLQPSSQNPTIPQINKYLLTKITNKLNTIQNTIEKSIINDVIDKKIKYFIQIYNNQIKTMINGIIGIYSINQISQKCTKLTKQTQSKLNSQQKQTQLKISQIYKLQLIQIFKQLITSLQNKLNNNKQQNNNLIINHTFNNNILSISSMNNCQLLSSYQNKQKQYLSTIQQLQNNIKMLIQQKNIKQLQCFNLIKTHQKQQIILNQSNTKLLQKLSKTAQIQQQKSLIDKKCKILQSKCSQYQKQLADFARNTATSGQNPQNRFNIQQTANKINELSQRCQLLYIETKNKDRRIQQLISQIKKQQLKNYQLINQINLIKGNILPFPNQNNQRENHNQQLHRSLSGRK